MVLGNCPFRLKATSHGPRHTCCISSIPSSTRKAPPPLDEDQAEALDITGSRLAGATHRSAQPGIHLRRLPGCLRVRHQGRAARRTGVPSPRADRDLGQGPRHAREIYTVEGLSRNATISTIAAEASTGSHALRSLLLQTGVHGDVDVRLDVRAASGAALPAARWVELGVAGLVLAGRARVPLDVCGAPPARRCAAWSPAPCCRCASRSSSATLPRPRRRAARSSTLAGGLVRWTNSRQCPKQNANSRPSPAASSSSSPWV